MTMDSAFLPERLEKFMKDSGLSFHESGHSYILDCPVCLKKNKLYIRKTDGETRCWHCYRKQDDPGGKPEFALSLLMGQTLGDVKIKLYQWRGAPETNGRIALKSLFAPEVAEDEIFTDAELPDADLPFESYPIDDPFYSKRGAAYLESRGVPLAVALEYDIAYWTPQRKVIFPVIMYGRLVGWQSRTIEKTDPIEIERDGEIRIVKPLKTLTYEHLQRDRALMFHDRLLGSKHAILTEGPVDALKAHMCGGNVATMGKVISDNQLDLVFAAGVERVYSGLDPDAVEDTAQLARKRGIPELYWMEIPQQYKDLGEMPMEEVLDVFHAARRVFATNVFVSFR